MRIPIGRGFAGRIAAERAAIYIADVDHAEILNPILREKGIRSLLGVPLIVEAEVIGVLHVGTLTPREFTNDDAALLQLAAARGGARRSSARASSRRSSASTASRWRFSEACCPSDLPEIGGVSASARATSPHGTRWEATGTT